MVACTGSEVSHGQYLAELDAADYSDILADPETARAYAMALAGRLA